MPLQVTVEHVIEQASHHLQEPHSEAFQPA